MRVERRIILGAVFLLVALVLAGCGAPSIDRVDVTWETDPPPRWGLYPGYRQEIPCPKGATYHIDVFRKGKPFTGGAISTAGSAMAFNPNAGARDIEAESVDSSHLNVFATLRDEKGGSTRLLALRIERKDGKIYFEFPK